MIPQAFPKYVRMKYRVIRMYSPVTGAENSQR
jgi:hypothetical protein